MAGGVAVGRLGRRCRAANRIGLGVTDVVPEVQVDITDVAFDFMGDLRGFRDGAGFHHGRPYGVHGPEAQGGADGELQGDEAETQRHAGSDAGGWRDGS